jgi:hypothetical protein
MDAARSLAARSLAPSSLAPSSLAVWLLAGGLLGVAGCGAATPAEPGDSGSRCERPDQCPAGQQCDLGGCVTPLAEDAECERDSQCVTGSCVKTSVSDHKVCD